MKGGYAGDKGPRNVGIKIIKAEIDVS